MLPTATHRITGLPMHELTDGAIDAVSLFGRDTEVMLDRLRDALGLRECVGIAEAFITRRLAGLRA